MEIKWLWTTLVIFLLIARTSNTQNLDSKWNNIYKQQPQSLSDSVNSNSNYRNLELELEAAADTKNSHLHVANSQDHGKEEGRPSGKSDDSQTPHSRQKRLIWVTDDGRLALPPGTTLSISPTIALPFVRYPPEGFLSNMTVSLPITIDFDKLGLTDNQNPLGTIPDYLGRSMGRAAGSILGEYVARYLHQRKKRALDDDPYTVSAEDNPKLPEEHSHAFHGGERAILYSVVEDFLSNFGLNGKACLLRAICEVHSKPVHQLGLVGEMLKLFFTASKSPYSDLLDEYVAAETTGDGTHGPGECFPYFKECPRSLFQFNKNRYQKKESDITSNDINSGPIVM